MWPFNSDDDELEQKVSDLEAKVGDLSDAVSRAERKAQNAKSAALTEKRRREELIDTLNDLFGPDHVEAETRVPYRDGEVQVLDDAHVAYKATENAIVELILPAGTRVVHPDDEFRRSGSHRKLRAEAAIVTAFYDPDHVSQYLRLKKKTKKYGKDYQTADKITIRGVGQPTPTTDNNPETLDDTLRTRLMDKSMYDADFEYRIGEVVEPEDDLDTSVRAHCASGIHFFRTLEGAYEWYDQH